MTAAATTGPNKEPRPTSSTPAINRAPDCHASFSNFSVQRRRFSRRSLAAAGDSVFSRTSLSLGDTFEDRYKSIFAEFDPVKQGGKELGSVSHLAARKLTPLLFICVVFPLVICFGIRDRSWHHIAQRLPLLLIELGMRERLAWHHLVTHRSVVNEDRFHHSRLFKVAGNQAFVHVHIGVGAASFVIERFLNELKAGNTDFVEGHVVGAAGKASADGSDVEILERRDPLLEDRNDRIIFLRIDAADFAASVVNVVVSGNKFVLRLQRERACGSANKLGPFKLLRRGRARETSEVSLHVTTRSKQALLFAAPETYANRTPRLRVQRGEDAHDLHRNDGAGAVIGGPRSGDPAIEMAANHDQLFFQFRIGAG